jgi:hypothetical protein
MEIRQPGRASMKLVEVRRSRHGITVTGQIAVAQIVHKNQQNIRPSLDVGPTLRFRTQGESGIGERHTAGPQRLQEISPGWSWFRHGS